MHALLPVAQKYAASGLSIFPVVGKRPNTHLLPWITDQRGDRKRSWSPFQIRIPNEREIKTFFSAHDTTGIAVACGPASPGRHSEGGLYIIDVDRIDWVEPFLARCGSAASRVLIQRTGRGGIQLAMICRGAAELRNQKLAMYSNPDWHDGASEPKHLCGIETRGFGGYACIAPSRHPNGRVYEVLQASWEDVPFADDDTVLSIIEAAMSFNEVMRTVQQESFPYASGRTTRQHRLTIPRLIMDTFMAEWVTIDAFLLTHRYSRAGSRRMYRPLNASEKRSDHMPGVLITENGDAAYFWSSNDPCSELNALGQPFHDIVGASVILDHAGDFYSFLEGTGQGYGIDYHRPDFLAHKADVELTRHVPESQPKAEVSEVPALTIFGQGNAFSILFLVDTVEAARAIEAQGVAAIYVPRGTALGRVGQAIDAGMGRWKDRYVLASRRDGFSDSLAECVAGKIIAMPSGMRPCDVTGADLFNLMKTAAPGVWDVGVDALRHK